ncbi:MAG: glutamate racemase [Christensenellales bacterium]|jgi:glutamate racemase
MFKQHAIGFFDSGLGGLSVLAAAVHQFPDERFLYLGDSANAPYGTRKDEEVVRLSLAAVSMLNSHGIKALVVACNTATGAAISVLRERYDFPIIGLEPALKPAAEEWRSGLILVMATPSTLHSAKFNALFERFGQHAQKLPCPGLMDFVEREEFEGRSLDSYLTTLFAPYHGKHISAVVLGCTHYLFLRKQIKTHLPSYTKLYDSNRGVIRQLGRRLAETDLLATPGSTGGVDLITTADNEKAAQMQRVYSVAQRLF